MQMNSNLTELLILELIDSHKENIKNIEYNYTLLNKEYDDCLDRNYTCRFGLLFFSSLCLVFIIFLLFSGLCLLGDICEKRNILQDKFNKMKIEYDELKIKYDNLMKKQDKRNSKKCVIN